METTGLRTRLLLLLLLTASYAQAQEFQILHIFTDGPDGAVPVAGLTLDQGGNLYGAALGGGLSGNGTVFRLTHTDSGWSFATLYSFRGGYDGTGAGSNVIFGPDGDLYGTTTLPGFYGPTAQAWGTVYKLSPPPPSCKDACAWSETILHRFLGRTQGYDPGYLNIVFDAAGNIYGTTMYGGDIGGNCFDDGCGVVYELTQIGEDWSYSVLYRFTGQGSDGNVPISGIALGQQGNLYGATEYGGLYESGNVYELIPSPAGWAENTIYSFGGYPAEGSLTFDRAGNLYGTTCCGGAQVYELSRLNGGWMLTTIHDFYGDGYFIPNGDLVVDEAGNLYGTTYNGGTGGGNVFKLTPGIGGWIYTDLHDFHGPDGASPFGGVTLDANGNIFGTTARGGDMFGCAPPSGCGVVWEITQD